MDGHSIPHFRVSEHHLISSLVNLFDCYLVRMIEGSELKGMSEHEQTPFFEGEWMNFMLRTSLWHNNDFLQASSSSPASGHWEECATKLLKKS